MEASIAAFELEDLETVERRERYVPTRNNDLEDKLESDTDRNNALTPTEKVLTAVRFYAFGNQQINLGDTQKMSQPSVSRIISEVSQCLAELRPQYIYLPQSEAERMEVSRSFYSKFGFPSVYGALDCTLIPILKPGGPQAETFRSRKKIFALNVQSLADSDLFIRNIVTRWPGSTHDSTVFDHSYLRAHLETEVPFKYHVLGDSGYPLRPYLMTPFLHPTGANQVRYNSTHARARNVVERQYGIWKRRFACLDVPFRCKLQNVQKIIVATAVLHNLALTMGDHIEEKKSVSDDDVRNNTHQLAGITKRNTIVTNFFN
ncbi:putative nuclease HARBI1 [Parasteatoda tepidariorum]|uniref:putative nuclease HARBI1 n=1 Tax=Parasteatoda tepidariorum TaxID=114398 RepID=UPI001C71EB83|nr:putative nuclease HARBI1 [Parasteatoda tepidariorum]